MTAMTFTESNTVEPLILDAVVKLDGTPVPMLHWNTSLAEFAL
jgi:hypothetical protein